MTIRILAHMTIKPEHRARFRTVVDKIMEAVRRKEAGNTLDFEYYTTDPDGLKFVVHEVYKDVDAYLAHGAHMATGVADEIMDLITIDWSVITGALPADMVARFKESGRSAYYGVFYAGIR